MTMNASDVVKDVLLVMTTYVPNVTLVDSLPPPISVSGNVQKVNMKIGKMKPVRDVPSAVHHANPPPTVPPVKRNTNLQMKEISAYNVALTTVLNAPIIYVPNASTSCTLMIWESVYVIVQQDPMVISSLGRAMFVWKVAKCVTPCKSALTAVMAGK